MTTETEEYGLVMQQEYASLMSFERTVGGVTMRGDFDIVDGKFDYRGNLPVSDAARQLFDYLADNCGNWWIERASKPHLKIPDSNTPA